MIKIHSRFDRPGTLSFKSLSSDVSIFEERIVNGLPRLVVSGKVNQKDFINASKEETLIYNILKRFKCGDVSVLSRTQGFYGDVTGMPQNLQESKNLLISLENKFNLMSKDLKDKFDGSFTKFVSEVSNMSVDDFSTFFGLNKKEGNLDVPGNIDDGGVVNE